MHRIKQALFHAAVVSDLRTHPLPPPHGETTKYFEPPRRVLKRAHQALEECKQRFEVKHGESSSLIVALKSRLTTDCNALVPRKILRQRKDGHVRAEDDDDEPLLLDQPPKRTQADSRTQSTIKSSARPTQTELSTQTTLVNDPTPSSALTKVGKRVKDDKDGMEVDSATEDEDEDEGDAMGAMNSRAKATSFDVPDPTFSSPLRSPSQSQSQPEAPTASQLAALTFDAGLPHASAHIGKARPLADFRSYNSASNREVPLAELVEEVGAIVLEIVKGPLARRRYEEMRTCLVEVRAASVKVCYGPFSSLCRSTLILYFLTGTGTARMELVRLHTLLP